MLIQNIRSQLVAGASATIALVGVVAAAASPALAADVTVTINEPIRVADGTSVLLPVEVRIAETIGVADALGVPSPPRAPTTTTVTVRNGRVAGQLVVTAIVDCGGPPATGTVGFTVDSRSRDLVSLDGSGVASIQVGPLSIGSHSINADYSGDQRCQPSTARPATGTVVNATSTTALSLAGGAVAGQPLILIAVVSCGGATPTGYVAFAIDSVPSGSGGLDSSGVARLNSGALSTGSHSLTADYSGDGQCLPSTARPLTPTVVPAPSTTTITSSPNPSPAGQSVQVTGTVFCPNNTPSGILNLTIDGIPNATPWISNTLVYQQGQTVWPIPLLPGSHDLALAYSGNDACTPSTATLVQVVNLPTTITLNPWTNPAPVNTFPGLTASLCSGTAVGGEVTFTWSGNVINTVPVDGGRAVTSLIYRGPTSPLPNTALPAGPDTIVVSYSGSTDGTCPAAVTSYTQYFTPPTSSVVMHAPSIPVRSDAVTILTASVTCAGFPEPHGTVTYYEGDLALGVGPAWSNGFAFAPDFSRTQGAIHTITAHFGADQWCPASFSAPIHLTVYNPVGPNVVSASPPGGDLQSPTWITIHGNSLIAATSMTIGSTTVQLDPPTSNTELTVLLPAITAPFGPLDITVSGLSGSSLPVPFYVTHGGSVDAVAVRGGPDPVVSSGGSGPQTPGSVTVAGTGYGVLRLARFSGDPTGAAAPGLAGYVDVRLDRDARISALSIVDCDLAGGTRMLWLNGIAWVPASNQSYSPATGCATVLVDGTTSPSVAQLAGTLFAALVQRPQTISFPPLTNHTYGDGPFTLPVTATSGLPVAIVAAPGGSCRVAGITVTILSAGPCELVANQGGNGAWLPAPEARVVVNIARAQLLIAADGKSKPYGTGLPALTFHFIGLVNGDSGTAIGPTLTTTATVASHVVTGGYPITAGGASDPNYSISYAAGVLTVTPVPLTIMADPKSKAYGAPLPVLTASFSGFVNGDSAASLTSGPTLTTAASAGSHVDGSPYPITLSGAIDPDYTISYIAGALTLTPVPLTITADDKTKPYGAPMPALTATYSGFVNGDSALSLTALPALTSGASATSHVAGSPYANNAAGAVDTDYTISYVPGRSIVTAVPLTIRAEPKTKVYGAALPALTVSYDGLVNGDTAATFAAPPNTPPTTATTATSASHVAGSPYAITASGAADTDYVIGYTAAVLTVTPANLTLTADSKSKVYGAPMPTLTTTWTGLVNGDTPATFGSPPKTPPVLTTTATGSSHVAGSPYVIGITGASNSDYSITHVPGTVTVTPADLTVRADSKEMVYHAVLPPLTVSYQGFVNGDAIASLTTPAHASTAATSASPPSGTPYEITASGAVDTDYRFVYVSGTLSIYYRFQGFLSPRPFTTVEDGNRLLVSFRLCDTNNLSVSNGTATLDVDGSPAKPFGTFNRASAFRFTLAVGEGDRRSGGDDQNGPRVARCRFGENQGEEGGGTYAYWLSLAGMAPGTHLLTAHIDDTTLEQILIVINSGRQGHDGQEGEHGNEIYLTHGSLLVSPSPIPAFGQTVTVAGAGFAPSARVRVAFGPYLEQTVPVAADGTIKVTFRPPVFDLAGTYEVTATGAGRGGTTLALHARVRYALPAERDGHDSDGSTDRGHASG